MYYISNYQLNMLISLYFYCVQVDAVGIFAAFSHVSLDSNLLFMITVHGIYF